MFMFSFQFTFLPHTLSIIAKPKFSYSHDKDFFGGGTIQEYRVMYILQVISSLGLNQYTIYVKSVGVSLVLELGLANSDNSHRKLTPNPNTKITPMPNAKLTLIISSLAYAFN